MLFRGFIVLHWRTRSHPVSRLSPLWHVQVQEMLVIPPLALYSKSMTNWAPNVTNNRWGLPLWALSSKQWCNTFFYSTFLHPGTKWTFQNQVEAKGNRCFGWVFYVHWQHVSDFVGGCFRIEESERSNCSGGWILCSSLNMHDANKHFLEEGDEMFVWKPENRAFTKHLPMVKVFLKHCLLCWHVDREKLQRLPFIHSLHSSVMLTLYYNFRTVNKRTVTDIQSSLSSFLLMMSSPSEWSSFVVSKEKVPSHICTWSLQLTQQPVTLEKDGSGFEPSQTLETAGPQYFIVTAVIRWDVCGGSLGKEKGLKEISYTDILYWNHVFR